MLSAIGVKYLYDMKDYQGAYKIYIELEDSDSKDLLKQEAYILKFLQIKNGEQK
ncbi:hypothetical protein [Lactovum miscens]|uniref:Uncharacterized protein n=1 Tax=Lactovum miscens TaxID=190387 RepID=A0A841C5V5_9LACT|nr:hypothetical protein [Lactovum miscens]MBB5888183.1 hypothetical protein [Lactovum miscens]